MHVKIIVVTTIAALWNLAFTISAPLSIARQRDFEFKETTAFDASSAQVPITGLRSSPIFPAPPSPDSSSPSPPPQSPTTAAAAVDTYPTHFVLPVSPLTDWRRRLGADRVLSVEICHRPIPSFLIPRGSTCFR